MCSFAQPLGGVSPAMKQSARPRREMASPSYTSGRSPPKESGPAHPQFANCPACAAKWTRPPGAGWAPGASRGRSSGLLSSVLAVKKTNTLNGRLLLPRPTFKSDVKTQAPLLVAEWYRQNPPEPSRAPCPTLGGNQTSRLRAAQPPLLFPTLGRDLVSPFITRAPRTASSLGQMPRAEPRALRPFPSPRWWQRRPWMASPLPPLWTVPPGSVPPQPGRFWVMGLSTPPPAGPSKGAAG